MVVQKHANIGISVVDNPYTIDDIFAAPSRNCSYEAQKKIARAIIDGVIFCNSWLLAQTLIPLD